jgi:hypothetical protein
MEQVSNRLAHKLGNAVQAAAFPEGMSVSSSDTKESIIQSMNDRVIDLLQTPEFNKTMQQHLRRLAVEEVVNSELDNPTRVWVDDAEGANAIFELAFRMSAAAIPAIADFVAARKSAIAEIARMSADGDPMELARMLYVTLSTEVEKFARARLSVVKVARYPLSRTKPKSVETTFIILTIIAAVVILIGVSRMIAKPSITSADFLGFVFMGFMVAIPIVAGQTLSPGLQLSLEKLKSQAGGDHPPNRMRKPDIAAPDLVRKCMAACKPGDGCSEIVLDLTAASSPLECSVIKGERVVDSDSGSSADLGSIDAVAIRNGKKLAPGIVMGTAFGLLAVWGVGFVVMLNKRSDDEHGTRRR